MKTTQIKAIGAFFMYYQEDLEYISKFQTFKKGGISISDYLKKEPRSFYSFLIEFKVIRNIIKGSTGRLLNETNDFINSTHPNNVDLFAKKLAKTGLTRGSITTSLASKILFLNNPWMIFPMDKRARQALHQNENNYSYFQTNLEKFRVNYRDSIEFCLTYIEPLACLIEEVFLNDIPDMKKIRVNRMIDKLLWTISNDGR